MTDANTDRRRLRAEAYADSGRLRQRLGLHGYARRGVGFASWALGSQRVTGVDLSAGMATEASTHAPVAAADVVALPFANHTFDVALAMHMLYHRPDVVQAVRELARVVTVDGVVAISTNGDPHLAELRNLFETALTRTGSSAELGARSYERVRLDNLHEFTDGVLVEVHRFVHEDIIEVTEADPVIDYLDSIRSLYADRLVGIDWDRVLREARLLVETQIASDGSWITHQHAGVAVFRPRSSVPRPGAGSRSASE